MSFRLLFILSLVVFYLQSCERKSEECKADSITVPSVIEIEYANNFELLKTNNGYSLQILNPENGDVEKKFSVKNINETRIISLSATLNGMLAILKGQNQLVGIGNSTYLFDSTIIQMHSKNKIQSFGDLANISLEKIIASKANIILYSGFGDHFPNEQKLKKLGIQMIPIYDWREHHPLGKAEWIKLVGILTGKEKEASEYFNNVVKEYNKLLAITNSLNHSPSVLSGSLYGDVWYAPGGNGYFSTLLNDAGSSYIYSETKGTHSQEYTMEKILKDNLKTDYWINSGVSTKSDINKSNPKAKYLKAYQNSTYCYSHNMNQFWEQSASMPHLLLKDLTQILHPELKLNEELYFYKKVE